MGDSVTADSVAYQTVQCRIYDCHVWWVRFSG